MVSCRSDSPTGHPLLSLGDSNQAKEERLMDVIDAIHSRRSIRSYQSNLVDRDLIDSVIWDAAQAPPPFSGQVPWTFNVIEGVERIAALGRTSHGPRPRNAAGFVKPAVA
jgi:nitroreductase